jgi:hypothetical protein
MEEKKLRRAEIEAVKVDLTETRLAAEEKRCSIK